MKVSATLEIKKWKRYHNVYVVRLRIFAPLINASFPCDWQQISLSMTHNVGKACFQISSLKLISYSSLLNSLRQRYETDNRSDWRE